MNTQSNAMRDEGHSPATGTVDAEVRVNLGNVTLVLRSRKVRVLVAITAVGIAAGLWAWKSSTQIDALACSVLGHACPPVVAKPAPTDDGKPAAKTTTSDVAAAKAPSVTKSDVAKPGEMATSVYKPSSAVAWTPVTKVRVRKRVRTDPWPADMWGEKAKVGM